MEKLLEKLTDYIKEEKINIFDVALMRADKIYTANLLEKRTKTINAFESGSCPDEYTPDIYEHFAAYPNYSMTKLLITTMIGILVDDGVFGLDDKITALLKSRLIFDCNPVWDDVTVRHALKHSMGIDFGAIDIDRDDPNGYPDDLLKFVFGFAPKHTPGSYRKYTDIPHYILSNVILETTGEKTQDIISGRILRPLNIRQTAWCLDERGNAIGSSGSFMSASDAVRLAWLYKEGGCYGGNRILSEKWCETAVNERFDIYRVRINKIDTGFKGKGGMNGQMTMYSKELDMAAAWHGYETDMSDVKIAGFLADIN